MATSIVQLKTGEFVIDSLTGASRSYRVDPVAVTCTCPHWTGRLSELPADDPKRACKHVLLVREHVQAQQRSRYCQIVERAEQLSTERLKEWAKRYQASGDAEVWGALLLVLAKRKQAASREAALKAVFS